MKLEPTPLGYDEFIEKYPVRSGEPIPAVAGIEITDAYHCPLTGQTTPRLDSLHGLASKLGYGDMFRKRSFPCKAQNIFAAKNHVWRVNPPPLPPPTSAPQYFDQYLSKLINMEGADLWTTVNTVKASRVTLGDRTPFHQEIGWIDWISSIPKDQLKCLRAAIAFPPFTNGLLLHAVRCYLDRVFSMCTPRTIYVRERLTRHDQSAKRPRPFVGLSCRSSFYDYSKAFAVIINLAIKVAQDDELPVDLSDYQRQCALELFDCLRKEDNTMQAIEGQLHQTHQGQVEPDEEAELEDREVQDGDDDDAADEEIEVEAGSLDDHDDQDGGHADILGTNGAFRYHPKDRKGLAIPEAPIELVGKVHALARALFTEELTGSEMNHPAMVYAMVTAVPETAQVKRPREICKLLAKVQYGIRATILFEVARVSVRQSINYDLAMDGLHRWVTSTHPSIFRAIRHGIRLSAKACLTEVGLPKIMPTNNTGTEWDFGGELWDLASYRTYVTSLPTTCREKITSLMRNVECGDIWDKLISGPSGQGLREDVGRQEMGYSVINDPKNQVEDLWMTMLRRMVEAGHLREWLVNIESEDGEGQFEWNVQSCQEFVQGADEVCGLLHTATFESFPTPPRAEEFAATLISDTSDRGRNLQMINNLMTYILRYCKTTGRTGFETPTCRVVSTTLKYLTLFFICIIRPMAWFLATHVLKLPKKKTDPLKTHLWWLAMSGRYLNADDLTACMRKEISQKLDPKYKQVYCVRANRHIKKYLGRRFLQHHPTAKLINSQRAQNMFEVQTGHSMATALTFYAKQGGIDHHPEIDPRLLREHQCIGQAMLSVLGFAPPPEGNLELDRLLKRVTVLNPAQPNPAQGGRVMVARCPMTCMKDIEWVSNIWLLGPNYIPMEKNTACGD
ncbi:hypothetical protein FRC01_002844 [Tulasnella sp. 417]|nr:hypothetical protein FRC01_002844 [Tulasnella sp. 417]